MPDNWKTYPIVCGGGIDLFTDTLTAGIERRGVALELRNYEPALEGGYEEILGYEKWDEDTVPGDAGVPITGVGVALGSIYATRKTSTDNRIYKSSGSGWGSALNSVVRTGTVTKSRFHRYWLDKEYIVQTDGNNPAWRYDGTSETLINGTGAPTSPSFASEYRGRLALAEDNTLNLSSPTDDTDFNGTNGAISFNIGDTILGIKKFREQLYIFCENSIWKLIGQTSADFEILPVTESLGLAASDSIQELSGDIIFLGPDGFRSLAATERLGDVELGLVSKQIQPNIRIRLADLPNYIISSTVIRDKTQYRCFFIKDEGSDSDQSGFLGRLEEKMAEGISQISWSNIVGIPAYCADSQYDSETEIVVFGHPSNGFVYQMEKTNGFDGSPISSLYTTPNLLFDDPELRKCLQKLKVYARVNGSATLTVETILGFNASGILQPPDVTFTFDGGGAAKYGSAKYGSATYGSIESFRDLEEYLCGSALASQFKFTKSDATSRVRIENILIEYSIHDRR